MQDAIDVQSAVDSLQSLTGGLVSWHDVGIGVLVGVLGIALVWQLVRLGMEIYRQFLRS